VRKIEPEQLVEHHAAQPLVGHRRNRRQRIADVADQRDTAFAQFANGLANRRDYSRVVGALVPAASSDEQLPDPVDEGCRGWNAAAQPRQFQMRMRIHQGREHGDVAEIPDPPGRRVPQVGTNRRDAAAFNRTPPALNRWSRNRADPGRPDDHCRCQF
jgi:hypothetical protein